MIKTSSEGKLTYFECESDPGKISDDFPVLKELCQRMSGLTSGSTLAVGSFLGEARQKPYGAGGTSLILVLAHVVRAFGERLRVFKDSTLTVEQPVASYEGLVEIVAAKIVFEVRDISPEQRKLVDGVALAAGAPPLKHKEARSLKAAFEAVAGWWHDLPPVARILDLYPKDQRKRLSSLKDIMGDLGKIDCFDLLLNRLPSLYTGSSAESALSSADVEKICTDFAADMKAFGNGLAHFHQGPQVGQTDFIRPHAAADQCGQHWRSPDPQNGVLPGKA